MGSRWANKNLCHYEHSKFRCTVVVKSKLDVQALVSLPLNFNKLSRMVVSTTYDTQVNLTHVT